MKRIAWSLVLLLTAAVGAPAAPLNPEHVPEDAKWVIHVDFDALRDTALVEKLREERPQVVQGIRGWLQERYGINPRQDLKGATLFSDTYAAHTGAIVLLADFDPEKVKAEIQERSNVKTTEWQGHTLYTWRAGKKDKRQDDQEQRQREGDTVTVVLLDGEKAVFASSPERAKSVVRLLKGEEPSLKDQESELLADVPEGAVVYGAAIELQDIARRDRAFPILRQHQRIIWSLGEEGDEVFETATLEAQSEEVAQQMKEALEGLAAFIKVWAADSENLKQVAEQVEITVEGATVQVHWRADSQTVLAALEELKERFQEQREAVRREARR